MMKAHSQELDSMRKQNWVTFRKVLMRFFWGIVNPERVVALLPFPDGPVEPIEAMPKPAVRAPAVRDEAAASW